MAAMPRVAPGRHGLPGTPPPRQHNFCPRHDRERKQLYVAYKSKEEYYRGIEVKHGDVDAKAKIEAKLAAGKETLQVRDQVNRRFFSLSEDNRGHVKWILKLQAELHDLDIELASLNAEPPAGPAPPPQPQAAPLTFRSLLHPSVPMSALSHLPDDSHVVILKRVGAVFLTAMVEKLYAIAPSLTIQLRSSSTT